MREGSLGCAENEEVRMGQIFLNFVSHVKNCLLSLEHWGTVEGDLVILWFVEITQPVLIGTVCMLCSLLWSCFRGSCLRGSLNQSGVGMN